MNTATIAKRGLSALAQMLPDRLHRTVSATRRNNPGPMQPAILPLPPEFDPAFYRARAGCAPGLSDAALRRHFISKGIAQGRPGSRACWRDQIAHFADAQTSVLEIGPFCNPVLQGAHIRYFDVMDSAQLASRAARIGMPGTPPANIDYVSATGDLAVVGERFSAVLSCHCIEHQPDLVRHLRQVADILDDGGRYFLIIPDRRFCFDHFLTDSNVAQVIQAHMSRRIVHEIESVVEHRALTTHNNPARHWSGDHADAGYEQSIARRAQAAMEEHAAAGGGYVDVHAWKFTPEGFRSIINVLFELGLISLEVERVYNTPYGRTEFTAVLEKRKS